VHKHKKNLNNRTKPQGLICKTATLFSFLRPAMDGGQEGTGRRRRRRLGRRGARTRPGIGRGGRGDPVDELTRDGDEGKSSGFEGQRRASPAVRSLIRRRCERLLRGGGAAGGAGRRLGLARRGRPPFYGARGEAAWPDCRGQPRHGCLADGPGSRAEAGWVGPHAVTP
jgi:hypothetical protein